MKRRPVDDEPTEQTEEPAGESDEPSRSSLVALAVAALLIAWRLVVVFPEVAYVVVGTLATLGWQKYRSWITRRRERAGEDQPEAAPPDIGQALRRLVGDDNGVLLTRLRDDLKAADTKAVKRLLDDAGITWKAVRTRHGNGPGVHVKDIPPALSPVANSHGDGCCCRSGDNTNGNNGRGEGAGEGIRVQDIGDGGRLVPHHAALENIVERFFAEAAKKRRASGEGEVGDG